MPSKTLYKFLRNGASRDMNVNGSVTPVNFSYTAGDKQVFKIFRLNFRMRDATLRLNRFGGLATLTNGLKIEHLAADGTVYNDFHDGETLKDLDSFTHLAGVDNLAVVAAAGDDSWALRWTLAAAGKPYELEDLESLNIKIQDDLSTITHFDVMVQGVLEY